MQQSPLEFVQSMGWEHRLVASQIEVKVCPFCLADDWKFRINADTGLWDCKHLNRHNGENERGNLFTLRKALGLTLNVEGKDEKPRPLGFGEYNMVQNCHRTLLAQKADLQVLMDEWCITEETVKRWKLGYLVNEKGTPVIMIPHFIGEELYNIKHRSWFGHHKFFYRIQDASSVLLNEEILLDDENIPESVLLCEGEKDAILAIQSGFENTVGMTGGAGTLTERWFALLERIPRIYVAYDGDGAGESGTEKLIRRLGAHRVRIVDVPKGMDVADIVKKFGAADLMTRIENAKEPRIKAVERYKDILTESILREPVKPIPTPWPGLNARLGGGIEPGHLITITAPPKIGKTSMTLYMANHWSAVLGIPTLYWCVEMSMQKLANYLVSIQFGTTRKPTKAQRFVALKRLDDIPMYLGFSSDTDEKTLVQTFADCYHRFGIGAFFFDNIHYMVRGVTDGGQKSLAIENVVKAFKTFALDYMVPVVQVAQPTKTAMAKGANLDYTGIGWSGSFASDSDAILILHRDRVADIDEAFRPEMMVKVDAARESAGGMTYLMMQEQSLQFREMSRNEITAMKTRLI